MNRSPSARGALATAAWALGVWTVLLALFAMHGLPMQSPGAMSMASAGASTSTTMPGTPSHAMPAATATHAHDANGPGADDAAALMQTDGVGVDGTERTLASDSMQGCEGSDHCTATLRGPDAATAPAVVDLAGATVDRDAGAHLPVAPIQAARPPDLDTLQISRT